MQQAARIVREGLEEHSVSAMRSGTRVLVPSEYPSQVLRRGTDDPCEYGCEYCNTPLYDSKPLNLRGTVHTPTHTAVPYAAVTRPHPNAVESTDAPPASSVQYP